MTEQQRLITEVPGFEDVGGVPQEESRPTLENPEYFDTSSRYPVVRTGGSVTQMRLVGRYFRVDGQEVYMLEGDEIETDASGKSGYPEKRMLRTKFEAMQSELRVDQELGAGAVVQTVELAQVGAERTESTILKEMDALVAGLSENDKTAIWWYANALYAHEYTSARNKMSEVLRNNHKLLVGYADLFAELKKLRDSKK